MIAHIFFTHATILRPLEVAPGASAPLCPPLATPLVALNEHYKQCLYINTSFL